MKKIFISLSMVFLALSLFADPAIYAPTLLAPADGAANRVPNVQLDWDAVAGAVSYKIELSTDSTFATTHKFSTAVTAYNTSELLFGAQYWWRVKAIGFSDSSGWSNVRTFTVIDKVTILAPVDSAIQRLVKMQVKWTAISGVTFYEWEVDSALTFDSPLHRTGSIVAPATETFTSQLYFGQPYYLRMRTGHALDTCSWSPVVMFTTLNDFVLRKPTDGSVESIPTPTLKWKYTGSTHYEIAMATDSAMTAPFYFTADSSTTEFGFFDTTSYVVAPALMFGTQYFWTVRAMNAFDTTGWMIPWRFTTLDTVILEKPVNADLSASTLPKFEWKHITGISEYLLVYDTNAGFSNPTHISAGPDSSYTMTTHLEGLTKYYWKVHAITAVDTTTSGVWNFKTVSGIGMNDNLLIHDNISLYPNPCRGKLTVDIMSHSAGHISLSVSNILGQNVMLRELLLKKGRNISSLDFEKLPTGIYMITLQNGTERVTRKISLDK